MSSSAFSFLHVFLTHLHISYWQLVGRICKTGHHLKYRTHSGTAWLCILGVSNKFCQQPLQHASILWGRSVFKVTYRWSHKLTIPQKCSLQTRMFLRLPKSEFQANKSQSHSVVYVWNALCTVCVCCCNSLVATVGGIWTMVYEGSTPRGRANHPVGVLLFRWEYSF